jgi:MoaA/NifB/PqqE/SkfB family radical SAM enzyme
MITISKYKNGNTTVTIKSDGTKIREYEGIPIIEHPESIDVKITNYCDLGCKYCHESSTTEGNHADLNQLLEVLSDLPSGVELAIGGGNPLSHPGIVDFLGKLKERGIIANITVNQGHLKPYYNLIRELILNDLVKGVGISITSKNFKHVKSILEITDNVVYHVIAGVNEVSILDELISLGKCKALILGYKHFGFGVNFHSQKVEDEIRRWYRELPKYLRRCTISFDNLAIEQLNVRRLFTNDGWNRFYMGDDFVFTMYIDAVRGEYAPTSRSGSRVSFRGMKLVEYFKKNRNGEGI